MTDRGWDQFREMRDAEAARLELERGRPRWTPRSWGRFGIWLVIGGLADAAALAAAWQLEFFILWALFLPFAVTSVVWLIGITLRPRDATAIAWGIVAGIVCVSAFASRWAFNNIDRDGMVSGAIIFSAIAACPLIGVLAAVHRLRRWTGR